MIYFVFLTGLIFCFSHFLYVLFWSDHLLTEHVSCCSIDDFLKNSNYSSFLLFYILISFSSTFCFALFFFLLLPFSFFSSPFPSILSSLQRLCCLVYIYFFSYLLSGRKTAIWGPAETNFHHQSNTHTHQFSLLYSQPPCSNIALNTGSHHLLIPSSLYHLLIPPAPPTLLSC